MGKYALTIFAGLILISSCNKGNTVHDKSNNLNVTQNTTPTPPKVTRESAIELARQDAIKEGENLELYEIIAIEQTDNWRVVFKIKNKNLNGGGPKYLIDKNTGEIISRQTTQ
ncbi:MAG: hypothetical protein ACJ754_04070 [Pyrinomonadaceae bacterium]